MCVWVKELKRRVAKLQEGDAEAIPSVFEAILQRYLAGKPIEADQELMRGILELALGESSSLHWDCRLGKSRLQLELGGPPSGRVL